MQTAYWGVNPADHEFLNRLIEQCRNRLVDFGWFMKYLNEPMARQAKIG
ncbi:MAG: hypothetical protein ACJAVI_006147 [Candidatus Azotimanducaceae bacterium]|jgi:hypothetical protein